MIKRIIEKIKKILKMWFRSEMASYMTNDERWNQLRKDMAEGYLSREEKKLIDSLELEFKFMRKKLETNPNETYYNNKYPKKIIYYNGRFIPKFGNYKIDVINFFTNSNANELNKIASQFKGTDDKKAWLCQKWIRDNIRYVSDKEKVGLNEYWMYPSETLKLNAGDCDDGAILMANLMISSGIPYWKIRINAGDVFNRRGVNVGGHAYLTYYCEEKKKWVALDWCFYPDENVSIAQKPDYKDSIIYGNGEVWFSFNQKYAYSKSATDVKKMKDMELKR
jgi:hypothetical protein